jgi:hypothetical protein
MGIRLGNPASVVSVTGTCGKCAGVSDESTADRAAIIQGPGTGGANQQW